MSHNRNLLRIWRRHWLMKARAERAYGDYQSEHLGNAYRAAARSLRNAAR